MAGSDERRAWGTPLNGDRERTEYKEGKRKGDVGVVDSAKEEERTQGREGGDRGVRHRQR